MSSTSKAAALLASLALAASSQALPQGRSQQPPRFRAVLLESPGHPGLIGNEEALAVNASGETAGRVFVGDAAHAARWAPDGSLTLIGTTGGCAFSEGADINDDGVVVGSSKVGAPDNAFRWSAASGTTLLPLPARCYPEAVDAQGTVAFTALLSGSPALGGTWSPVDGAHRLLLASGDVFVRDLNDFGAVTGLATFPGVGPHTFRWTLAEGLVDLGVPWPFDVSHGLGINDAGVVVGLSRAGSTDQATMWEPGQAPVLLPYARPLSQLASAHAINSSGWIVGYEYESPAGWARPSGTLWVDGIAYDLTRRLARTPGGPFVHVLAAWDVNDSGQIAARGWVDGVERALSLDPIP
jgi:uncharacterized membrane protein